MVHYEYVGRLGEHTLLCVSVGESLEGEAWEVQTHLLIVPANERGAGRIELARASYTDPLEAVEDALALSRELELRAARTQRRVRSKAH